MKSLKNIGLTTRFISWFLFIGLVPMVVVAYMSYVDSQKALLGEVQSKLDSVHTAISNNIATYFNDQKALLSNLAVDSGITSNLGDAKKLEDELATILKINSSFIDLFVVDKNGKVIASTERSE